MLPRSWLRFSSFRTHNIVDWLAEVRCELKRQGIADYLLIIWDEFTTLLDSTTGKTRLLFRKEVMLPRSWLRFSLGI